MAGLIDALKQLVVAWLERRAVLAIEKLEKKLEKKRAKLIKETIDEHEENYY